MTTVEIEQGPLPDRIVSCPHTHCLSVILRQLMDQEEKRDQWDLSRDITLPCLTGRWATVDWKGV